MIQAKRGFDIGIENSKTQRIKTPSISIKAIINCIKAPTNFIKALSIRIKGLLSFAGYQGDQPNAAVGYSLLWFVFGGR